MLPRQAAVGALGGAGPLAQLDPLLLGGGPPSYDARAVDAWAMGVMLFLLTTSKYPFEASGWAWRGVGVICHFQQSPRGAAGRMEQ